MDDVGADDGVEQPLPPRFASKCPSMVISERTIMGNRWGICCLSFGFGEKTAKGWRIEVMNNQREGGTLLAAEEEDLLHH